MSMIGDIVKEMTTLQKQRHQFSGGIQSSGALNNVQVLDMESLHFLSMRMEPNESIM